jgi:predicted nucleic acid-binding protein
MKVLFDTNVVLDVLLAREPHASTAASLFSLVDNGRLDGRVCATTVTTVDDVATRAVGARQAKKLVRQLLDLFGVAAVDSRVLEAALRLEFADFEDAVVHEAAKACGAAGIVTRNGRDFTRASLPVFDPHELLSAIVATRD